MNLTALIDRLDDWINPIVVKELRQAVKSRVVIVLLLVFLALQLFIVGMALLFQQARSFDGESEMSAGRDVFVWIQGVLAFTLILLVPAYACVRLAAERSDQNVDLLFISTLKPHSIVAGKFFAAFMLGVLIFSCCAPFMTFMYLLRGLDIPTILLILAIDLVSLLYATMFAMLLAAIPGGLVVKVISIFLGYVLHLFSVAYFVIGMTVTFVTFMPPDWDSPEFWAVTSAIMSMAVVAVGLMFTYCTALVSPSSSNRVLLIRVYVLAVWALSLAALWLTGRSMGSGNPKAWMGVLITWMIGIAVVLGMQFIISVSERDQYGPRLQRQIPRNLLLRVPAFFLYVGAANGIVYTMTLALASLLIGAVALDRAHAAYLGTVAGPGGPSGSESSVTFQLSLVVLLYLYNYGISAVLLRVYLLGGQVRAGFTWLVQTLLIGLGSAIPPLIAFSLFPDQMNGRSEVIWWKLPSPFLAIFNISNDFPEGTIDEDYLTTCLWFLGIWFVLVTLLSLPWMIRQVLAFRPRVRPQPEAVPMAELAEPEPPKAPAAGAPAEGMVAGLPQETSVQSG